MLRLNVAAFVQTTTSMDRAEIPRNSVVAGWKNYIYPASGFFLFILQRRPIEW
jgi:hypothetical protein